MAYGDRVTACISSQAGCAMGCTFCATGQAGYPPPPPRRELLEQVAVAARPRAAPLSQRGVHGHGRTARQLRRHRARRWARSRQTGALRSAPDRVHRRRRTGIERLALDAPTVTLAVSLHAANDELRDSLVPLNATYPLERVQAACLAWTAATRRRVSFEWALIDAVNDRPSDARELAVIARRCGAHVNLIALNPTPGYPTPGTPRRGVVSFRDALVRLGVNATIRATRGQEIDAACGQLAAVAGARPTRVRAPRRAPTPT